jgi:hypothetical protein
VSVVRLAQYARHGAAPLAVATIDPQGCGEVQLTIGDQSQPSLEGGGSLIHHIEVVVDVERL